MHYSVGSLLLEFVALSLFFCLWVKFCSKGQIKNPKFENKIIWEGFLDSWNLEERAKE
jgi:hypothetical protein